MVLVLEVSASGGVLESSSAACPRSVVPLMCLSGMYRGALCVMASCQFLLRRYLSSRGQQAAGCEKK